MKPQSASPFPSTARVISGGQTGVDRAALDAAIDSGLQVSGWCPAGRRSADGTIPRRYPLIETESPEYAQRTRLNLRDTDATLILHRDGLHGGTLLTRNIATELNIPVFLAEADRQPEIPAIVAWLKQHRVYRLNIAGPREQTAPGIYEGAYGLLYRLFEHWPSRQDISRS